MSPAPAGDIDVHAHYLPPAYRAALQAQQLWMVGGLPVPEWSEQAALDFMDAHGVALQLLSISDPGVDFAAAGAEAQELARDCNDFAAELIARRPERFGALAVLSLRDPQAALVEARRALDELRLDGVGLLSSAEGRYPGDPIFEPLLSELDARGAWVFVHPTAPPQRPSYGIPVSISEYPFDTTRAFISLLFNGVFERHPRIRWHFAHGGGTLPMLRLRLEGLAAAAAEFGEVLGMPASSAALDRGSLDRALAASHFDTALVADTAGLSAVSLTAHPEGVLFGSDWPFAARLYGSEPRLQPSIEDVFPAGAPAVRRGSAGVALPRLAGA